MYKFKVIFVVNDIEEKNIFMVCRVLNKEALSLLPEGYYIRNCRKNELDIWMKFPFDNPHEAQQYREFMESFFQDVYASKEDLFFKKCLFVCNKKDTPVGTCMSWPAYGEITTIHWFKVLKEYEGRGIGRALLSQVMQRISKNKYPVYLHTHPTCLRAIKLYSDFGFKLLTNPVIGTRENHVEEVLPFLEENMPQKDYKNLKTTEASEDFLSVVNLSNRIEF